MALLADGRISTIDTLQAIDASVVEVARVERVDLDRKLEMATDEVGLRVKKFLLEYGLASRVAGANGEVDLGKIVVTPGMAYWHALEALAITYSDAFFSQLNDRYNRKWAHYRDLATQAATLLFDTGVGAVSSGVRRAMPPVITDSGSAGIPGTYFVSIAWTNTSGGTGVASEPTVITTSELMVVAAAETVPAGWTFDVYAGPSDAEMMKQTTTPVAAMGSWTQPGPLIVGGPLPAGQAPEFYLRRERLWQRG